MDAPTLEVTLLGGFALRRGIDVVTIDSGRVRSLLSWLALHVDGPQPRQRVASVLWPESPDGQARTNLRNLVHQLRRAFPDIDLYLDTSGAVFEWRPGAPVNVDAVAFERALSGARADAADAASLEGALDLYVGPLLPDCYEPWIADEQGRLARLYLSGLEALLERCLESGAFGQALDAAARILRLDPLSERAHRGRILALAEAGDRASAVRAYHAYEALLAAELGVAPGEATRAAYRRVLGAEAERETVQGTMERSHLAAEGGLIGRAAERSALQRAWARTMETSARMVWVTGEPGIGKSRLVQALVEWIGRQGHRAALARAYPTQGALAYGPVVAWLRDVAVADALAAAPPSVRAEIGRLLPELRHDEPAAGPALTEAERRQRIHDAVIAVLTDAAAPSTYVIDDLQWVDRETVDLLNTLVLRSPRPLLVVATMRAGEVGPDHPLVRPGVDLQAADRLEVLDLEPLSVEDTAALARALSGRTPPDPDVAALHRETEGNPLFIVETLRSDRPWGASGGSQETAPRIRAVIEARLRPLSPDARTVTQIAAAVGGAFSLPLLLRASPLDEGATLRGLDEAWRRRLVRERGDGAYDFSHGKVREVAYRTTSPIRRRDYHRRIADVLEAQLARGEGGPEATPDQLAQHHDRGGSVAAAADWYERAARAAADVSALDAVRQLLGRALELLERLPAGEARDARELDIRLRLGPALVAEGYARPAAVANYDRARALCDRLGRPVSSPVLRALALAAIARGELEAGTRLGEELADAAERDDDDVARVEGAYVRGVMAFWKGDLATSERFLAEAVTAYRAERHRDHLLLYAQDPKVVCLSRLAWTLWLRGRAAESFALRDEAMRLAERHDDAFSHAYALWFTAFIAVDAADIDSLETQSRRMKTIAAAQRLAYFEAVADGFLAYVQAVRVDARAGIAAMRAILRDTRWTGMEYVLKCQMLLLLARAAAAAGDTDTAAATTEEAAAYTAGGPSIWDAPLAHLRARIAAMRDPAGEAVGPAFRDALDTARVCGAAWSELLVAVDHARWTIENGRADAGAARIDLERALAPYAVGPSPPAVAAGRVLLERLTTEVAT